MEWLEGLNESQREAVLYTEGPLMIIAGAGSGKTTVLTKRIAYMMAEKKIPPQNILALTFTNKAAKEMKERIHKVVGNKAHYLWMGTFHSIFAKILRKEANLIGHTSTFSIYDTDDMKSLIKTILKELNIDHNQYKPEVFLSNISKAKNACLRADEFAFKYASNNDFTDKLAKVYKIYEKRLEQANALDFDDLLFKTYALFKHFPDILHKYQNHFQYVLVDEYQDTNHVQYQITQMICKNHNNLCIVGDDAQSIYAFRGADIQNILNFQKDYPNAKVIKLELNYRSTSNIVQAANSVIVNNSRQIPKNCYTLNGEGEKIRLLENLNEHDEALKVAQYIREQKARHGYQNADFAILYRTNAQSRTLEDALRKAGIPYKVYGGLSFYNRKEVKDALAYLKLAINPYDEEALRRVINYPQRGIGETTIEKLTAFAQQNQARFGDIIYNIQKLGNHRFTNAINAFAKLIEYCYQQAQQHDAYTAAQNIIKQSGILKALKESTDPEDHARWENIQELLNAIQDFSQNPENENTSLEFFLQEAALYSAQDDNLQGDLTLLMTVHAAKGLEFTNVIITGLEEGLFPSRANEAENLEEERRLFYVALTRAKKHLAISYAKNRIRYGHSEPMKVSRFIDEIHPKYIEMSATRLTPVHHDTNPVEEYKFAGINLVKLKQVISEKPLDTSDFEHDDPESIQPNQLVKHFKFGKGKVIAVDGKKDEKKAIVEFEKGGRKTLLLKFAKLKIIPS